MAETQAVPEVGVGSPEGKRWFVCKYSEWSGTLRADQWDKDNNGFAFFRKGKHVAFRKEIKPRKLRGTGELGKGAGVHDGTDRNSSLYWGILETEDKEVINYLRKLEMYRRTKQDNRIDFSMELKELNWDPGVVHTERSSDLVTRRDFSLGQEDDITVTPPEETTAPITKVKLGLKKSNA